MHADAYGKNRSKPISWIQYKNRYLKEMQKKESIDLIISLAKFIRIGGTITLLCSSACTIKKSCHRILLKKIILAHAMHDKTAWYDQ